MRFASVLAALGLLVAVFSPAPGHAFDGPGCGSGLTGTYRKTASCLFVMRGSPITVEGDSQATGPTSVHVTVSLDGYPELPPLVECNGTGDGFASCDSGLPDETTTQAIPPQVSTVYLVCTVTGTGTGKYWCQSGPK